MTDRRKPTVAFWLTVVLALPVLYVLSFGPACWAYNRGFVLRNDGAYDRLYWPIGEALDTPLGWPIWWYARIGCPADDDTIIPVRTGFVFYSGWLGADWSGCTK